MFFILTIMWRHFFSYSHSFPFIGPSSNSVKFSAIVSSCISSSIFVSIYGSSLILQVDICSYFLISERFFHMCQFFHDAFWESPSTWSLNVQILSSSSAILPVHRVLWSKYYIFPTQEFQVVLLCDIWYLCFFPVSSTCLWGNLIYLF